MAQKQLYFTLLLIIAHQVSANEQQWKSFKEKYSKNYKDDAEELIRKKVFVENLAMIEEHNAKHEQGLVTYRKGVNEFADLEKEEFAKSRLGFRVKDGDLNRPNEVSILQTGKLPDKINWVDLGAVTGVKDQGACGSCWSFSTTGSLEGQYFVKNKKLVSLSEQNLVDCSRSYGNMGCEGGLMDNAFKYVHDNGIMSEDAYPYVAEDERCEFKINKSVLIDSSFVDIKSGSEADLQAAVANIGPISVAVDATEFQTYTDGIMKDSNCGNDKFSLNHGVLVVGYGTSEDGQDYWLVKNSWGERWGENGYIRIARNNENQCGIATAASYPVL